MSTINDLNTTLQNKIDLDEENIISTPLKKGNSGILNNKEIPSIEETVKHLQYNYEVLEIRRDYQGTLENLMRQQGKKIPKYLPFINLFLVGGGSSGGWIQDTSDKTLWHGEGYGGDSKFYYLNDIDLKLNIKIQIGKGGKSILSFMDKSNFNKDDYLPNPGGLTIFNCGNKTFETEQSIFKDYTNFKKDENILEYQTDYNYASNSSIVNDINKIHKEICSLDFNKYIPHMYKYVNTPGIIISQFDKKSWGTHGYAFYQDYNIFSNVLSNDLTIYREYFENKIINSLLKRPSRNNSIGSPNYNDEIYCAINEYGASSWNFNAPSSLEPYGFCSGIFFNGLDNNDIGMPGLSGSKTEYIIKYEESHPNNPIIRYQRGYCGKGGDGACFIYYPKEV